MQYQIFGENGVRSAISIVLSDGRLLSFNQGHANFDEVIEILNNPPVSEDGYDEEYLFELSKPALAVGAKLVQISERITFSEGNIFFDGDAIEGAEANHILRLIKANKHINEYRPLVLFLEKIRTNPSEHSRASLYDFLQRYDFTITREGNFIAYKGVTTEGLSIHSGSAIVNGTVVKGQIPNEINSVIEMPRSKVDDDTSAGCSTGLHAGTYRYASGFAQGRLLTVEINPRDVVSVPTDSDYQKIRTCRYTVVGVTEVEYTEPTWDDCDCGCEDCEDCDECDCSSYYDNDYGYDEDEDEDEVDNDGHATGVNEATKSTLTTEAEKDTVISTDATLDLTKPNVAEEQTPVSLTDKLAQALSDGAEISFDYEKTEGTVPVEGFTIEKFFDDKNLIVGLNAQKEYRTYRTDKMTNLVVNPKNKDKFSFTLPWRR